MKNRLIFTVFLVLCFYSGLGVLSPISLSYAEEYCPEDGSLCYEVTPLENVSDTTSVSPPFNLGSGPSFGSSGRGGVNKNMLQVGGGENSANANTNVSFKDNFLRNIQIYIMGLLGIVSVSVFLYIGYMLFTAQGKEEDFKKAWTALTYAVIGLAVIPLAFIAVKIVTGFTF